MSAKNQAGNTGAIRRSGLCRLNGDTGRRRWTHAVAAALSTAALLGTPVCDAENKERPYPLPGSSSNAGRLQAKGITLGFETWPPGTEETEPLVRKLRNAGLKARRAHPLFKSWVFAWDELHDINFAETMCFELALDDQVSSLFASCSPDAVLGPPPLMAPRARLPALCKTAVETGRGTRQE